MNLSTLLSCISKAELIELDVNGVVYDGVDRDTILSGQIKNVNADELKVVIWYSINDDKGESITYIKVV